MQHALNIAQYKKDVYVYIIRFVNAIDEAVMLYNQTKVIKEALLKSDKNLQILKKDGAILIYSETKLNMEEELLLAFEKARLQEYLRKLDNSKLEVKLTVCKVKYSFGTVNIVAKRLNYFNINKDNKMSFRREQVIDKVLGKPIESLLNDKAKKMFIEDPHNSIMLIQSMFELNY